MERVETLALVPARGGSEGIKKKNVRSLGGRPLIAWTLLSARRARAVTRLVVTTDDPEIAEVSRRYGAEVVDRPATLAGATASSEAALLHALDHLEAADGYRPDLVAFLQCTSPFRQPDDIDRAVSRVVAEGADSLFSAGPAHGFLWRCEDGGPRPLNYEPTRRPRRQDAPRDLVENGSIYVFRPALLRRTGSRLGGRIAVHPMAGHDSFQVDEPADLLLMEALLSTRRAAAPEERLGQVRLLLLDFDGVLTDNRVEVGPGGGESVRCHRGDGWGIARLRDAGVEVEVISTETDPVVSARCAKLGIRAAQGVDDKGAVVRARIAAHRLHPDEVAFVGNDVNDLAAYDEVGVPIAVADAVPAARAAAIWVTERRGGHGAVREVCDRLLRAGAAPEQAVRAVA
ncbi:MAG: cytidylyltransferase domain-containing protein [Sandaracinaceae bacterium]